MPHFYHGGHLTKDLFSTAPVMGGGGFGAGAAIYGVSWNKESSPTLTRTDDSVGWTCQAGVDAGVVTNDADSAEIYGEISEVTDASSNVFVRIPKFYIEKTDSAGLKTWRISKNGGGAGYLPKCFWNFSTGTPYDYIDVGKYPATVSGGLMQSVADVYPTTNTNIVAFRTAAEANGAGYQQLDIHVVDLLQTLFYVEFATLHSQSIMAGFTAGQYSATHVATATEAGANRIIVATAHAALFEIGQAISVGTSLGGNQIFYGRTITGKTVIDASNTALDFDGAAVNIAAGNIVYNTGYKNSDAIAATSGSVASNSTGKHYCKYREIISPWGNIWQFVDGLNVNEYQSWVCDDADDYASNLFAAPYEQLGFANHNADGYITAMGWDTSHPYAALPTVIGGAATTYYADYYYRNTGQRIALLGGSWRYGAIAGLSCWYLYSASSSAYVYVGARLVQRGG